MLREVDLQTEYLKEDPVNTLYFGGGTPSVLSVDEINRIIDKIAHKFSLINDPEITLEANPDDLSTDFLKNLKQYTLINRLSIGIQSYHDEDLRYLNRIHSGPQALEAISESLHYFQNLSIDLIYGIPTLTIKNWEHNLKTTINFQVPHISAYSLTVEPNTVLHTLIKRNKTAGVNEDQTIIQFHHMLDVLKRADYEHYEISNFCQNKQYAQHNTSYWKGEKYLGLGPSAHSFNGKSRQWNVSAISKYIDHINENVLFEEKEDLTETDHYNEYIMTSLRTIWGVDIRELEKRFGKNSLHQFTSEIEPFVIKGDITIDGSVYTLSDQGKLFADRIAGELFI